MLSTVGVALILIALCGLVFSGIWLSRFSRDESQWIYTARYLTLLTHGQFNSPEWDSYWTHTQPPLARYMMGASLKLGGFDLLSLNGPWDFSKEDSQNRAEGNWPSDATLAWARLPITLAAIAALGLLFLVGRAMAGAASGLFAAGWFALNPRLRELSTRAESEGLLVLLVLAALLLTIYLIARVDTRSVPRRTLLISTLVGLVSGLAASTKLTGALCLVCFWASLLAGLVFTRMDADSSTVKRLLGDVAAQIAASGLAAVLVFIVLNPYTYPNPLGRALSLFQYRQDEMAAQMTQYPTAALVNPGERIGAAFERPLFAYGLVTTNLSTLDTRSGQDIGEKIPLDALLIGIGIAVCGVTLGSAVIQRKTGRRSQRASETTEGSPNNVRAFMVTLVWTVISFVAIAVNLGLDWDRYVILLSLFSCIWAGVGAGWLYSSAVRRIFAQRSVVPEVEAGETAG